MHGPLKKFPDSKERAPGDHGVEHVERNHVVGKFDEDPLVELITVITHRGRDGIPILATGNPETRESEYARVRVNEVRRAKRGRDI